MSELETRLTAALRADEPPARDAVFRVEVLVRLEQERFRRHVRRAVVVAVLLAIVALVNLPAIDAWMTAGGQRLWFVATAATAGLCVLTGVMIAPRFRAGLRAVGRLLYP